jgi:N4-gp56 family major capsid protein
MAATFAATNAVVKGTSPTGVDYFIPELWSDEVLAAHKANLVMQQLVKVMPFTGQKGDTVRVPIPVRGSATAKAAANAVTLITASDTNFTLTIDQHYEYSRLIEDIVTVQALDSLRQFYTDDAGYALAIQEDTALHSEGAKFAAPDSTPTTAGSAYSKAVIGGDGSTVWSQASSGNGSALTDAGIRRAIQALDDNNVPDRQRALVIPPIEKRKLLGLSRFTEQAFTGEAGGMNSIRNGLVGDIYGIPVFVSTNCATVEANDSTAYRAALLFQKDAVVIAEQITPRTQTQPKLEFLADLFVADVLYGVGTPRPENGVALIVPNS